ncbi:MAG: ATP synthase F1 subunit gamma [Phycisphaeraceae bacterium]|nr:ATP synthase F1 subunit gamma [Phycisphaeraceae bacterium]
MGRTREIKGRIRAVGNIQRITRTMQMIATARFQAASGRVAASQPFSRKIAELVSELSSRSGVATHPLLQAPQPPTGRHLLLVLTSNRGLCGAYNANVLRAAVKHFRALREAGQEFDLEVVGKKGFSYMKFSRTPVSRFLAHFGEKVAYQEVEELAENYMERFEAGKYDSIQVIYMAFVSSSRQVPEVEQILPMQKPKSEPTSDQPAQSAGPTTEIEFEFSPEPETLLADLLPLTVKTRLFQIFNEATVSEHVARMTAMKAATDSAKKVGKALSLKYNRARQSAITTELNEIVSGAASVS